MIFLYYIFLIFQILKIKTKEINFKIPIEYTSDYEPLINMCLGTPPQCLKFKILTYLNYSYVLNKTKYNHGFDSNKSDSFYIEEEAEIEEYSDKYIKLKGYKCQDDFYIKEEDFKINYFTFYYVIDGLHSNDYDGVIGLGLSGGSFINHLSIYYDFGIRFIIETNHNEKKGLLTLGKLNNELRFDKEVYFYNDQDNYQVEMNKIIFYNEEKLDQTTIYKYSQSVSFSPGHNKILCPLNFFDYLLENVFTKFIYDEYDCKKNKDNQFVEIVCDKSIVDEYLGEILFIFGKWNLRFKFNDLFTKVSSSKVSFNIVHSNFDDRWIFGYPFFKDYDIIYDGILNKLIIK